MLPRSDRDARIPLSSRKDCSEATAGPDEQYLRRNRMRRRRSLYVRTWLLLERGCHLRPRAIRAVISRSSELDRRRGRHRRIPLRCPPALIARVEGALGARIGTATPAMGRRGLRHGCAPRPPPALLRATAAAGATSHTAPRPTHPAPP